MHCRKKNLNFQESEHLREEVPPPSIWGNSSPDPNIDVILQNMDPMQFPKIFTDSDY